MTVNTVALLKGFCAKRTKQNEHSPSMDTRENMACIRSTMPYAEATNSFIAARIYFPFCPGFGVKETDELLINPRTLNVGHVKGRYPETSEVFSAESEEIGVFAELSMEKVKELVQGKFEESFMKQCVEFSNKMARTSKQDIHIKKVGDRLIIFVVGNTEKPAAECAIALIRD